MRRLALAAVMIGAALLLPGRAAAGLTTVRAYDVPLHRERGLATVVPQGGFDLIGVHWQGPGGVEVRVLRHGSWGPWQAVDTDTAPDSSSTEARRLRGWRLGEPLWVGPSTRFEVRARGPVRRVRAFTVQSLVSRVPMRAVASAGQPPIVTRAQWQADESLRRAGPELAPTLRFAVVHHTAGPNTYTREQAPSVVRGIMAYHVQANGWNDIGYNALVDRFGTVYEGRYGGLTANVVGAHAKGFNTGSFGIAVIGDFTSTAPPKAAVDALVRTLAWRLDLAHVDPLSTVSAVSAGNERFQPGIPVLLRAISGHRDTGLTACPGDRLYALLPTIATRAAALGLPKLYDVALNGTWGSTMTLTARASGPLPWTITVTRRGDGEVVESVSGTGTDVAAAWDTSLLPPGTYDWRIDAPGATPAQGTLDTVQQGLSLGFTGASADPEVIAPNGDGTLDSTTITYTISAAANVSAAVIDGTGVEVATLEPARWRRAGEHVIAFDGLELPDGAYTIRLTAKAAGGQSATRDVSVALSRTLGQVSLRSAVLSPNGDGKDDRLGVRFVLSAPATVRVRVLRLGKWVATPFQGLLTPGAQLVQWDGTRPAGRLREGDYTAVVEATDAVATTVVSLPFVADWTPPSVAVASLAPPRLRVSEPATLRLVVNGSRRVIEVTTPGLVPLPGVRRLRTLVLTARDRAGNVTRLRRP